MSFDIADAKEAKQSEQGANLRENDAGIPDEHQPDYDSATVLDDVTLHPESFIVFDHIARISINDYGADGNILQMEQNLQGAGMYGFDVELTVADPQIVDGELWTDGDEEWPRHKVVGDPDADTNPYEVRNDVITDDDGNVTGADTLGLGDLPGGNSWDGERVDLDADYMTISVSSSRGIDILGVLDTAGRWFSDKEGNAVEGLFETPPSFGTDAYDSDNDPHPRLTGYPELRSDMVGQSGAILCEFDTDDPTEADPRTAIDLSLFRIENGDELHGIVPVTPDDDAYAKPTYPRTGNTMWDDGDVTGVDTKPDANGGVQSAQSMVTGDTSYADLSDKGQDFVDEAVTALQAGDMESVDEIADPSFAQRVHNESERSNIIDDPETLGTIVNNRR